MDKQTVIRDMKQSVGGASFITITELCKYLGRNDQTKVKKLYLSQLERVGHGFFIPDVAQSLMEARKPL